MSHDTSRPFDLPAASHKKVSANFDGGAISSDGGLMLLLEADRRLGLTRRLASCVQDLLDAIRHTSSRTTSVRADQLSERNFWNFI